MCFLDLKQWKSSGPEACLSWGPAIGCTDQNTEAVS